MIKESEIEVFILAGGKSRRMGSDKGLVNFKGEPMISHILRVLEKLNMPTSIISSNNEYMKFGKPVYQDLIPDKGPLGGLYTALEFSSSPMLILLACDMPSINSESLKRLIVLATSGKMVVSTDGKNISPLFACYPQSFKKAVKEAILKDELKMLDFVLKQSYTLLDLTVGGNTLVLQNLNTKKELLAAENIENDSD
ncbi:molybdenum cofactor guanylyltransferase [Gillisia sp. JM1]|uniref:molybdenum cofactor guanylyltransferase n=1 Tax=Gillisia sp. JM1 TaxID=1283286 RepID=UPI000402F868|nr:molybdenum cofactor guanylyltransferase [Gillisia sp. JM1]